MHQNIKLTPLLRSHFIVFLLVLLLLRSAPDAAPAGAPGAPGAPGADGAPAGQPPGPPNTTSNRRLQQTQAQVEEVSWTWGLEEFDVTCTTSINHDTSGLHSAYTGIETNKHVECFARVLWKVLVFLTYNGLFCTVQIHCNYSLMIYSFRKPFVPCVSFLQ